MCVFVFILVYVCVSVCVCVHTCVYVCVYVSECGCGRVVCICLHVYIHVSFTNAYLHPFVPLLCMVYFKEGK